MYDEISAEYLKGHLIVDIIIINDRDANAMWHFFSFVTLSGANDPW